jgi:hypothetical protein
LRSEVLTAGKACIPSIFSATLGLGERARTRRVGWVPRKNRSRECPWSKIAAKTAQKQIGDAEKKIGDAALDAQNQFLKTLEEMSREAMACASAEIERGLKLSKKLSAAHSVTDAVAAYQEWLGEEMSARSEDARRFMSNSQSFMTTSSKAFSNGWSGMGMST